LIAAVMPLIPSRLGRADCSSEIAVIEPPFQRTELLDLYTSKFNEKWRLKSVSNPSS
jgi:hypothetical protein